MSCRQRHLRREALLPEDEGLERDGSRFSNGEPREQAVHPAVGRAEVVVEAGVDPGLEVLPAPVGVDVRRPGHGQRVHAVLVLEHVRGVEAVLAARAGHEAVVVAVAAAVAVAQVAQLAARAPPSRSRVASPRRSGRRRRRRRRRSGSSPSCESRGVRELDGGVRPLVGDHAAAAEAHLARAGRTCASSVVGASPCTRAPLRPSHAAEDREADLAALLGMELAARDGPARDGRRDRCAAVASMSASRWPRVVGMAAKEWTK